MQILPEDDVRVLENEKNLELVIGQMTYLLDTNKKISDGIRNQNWFMRMWKTVTGKNKASVAEIQQNREKLSSYMAEALAELFNRERLDHAMMIGLQRSICELDTECLELKQMLGAFAGKLNDKINSVDGFHLLLKEIEFGRFSNLPQGVAIFEIASELDERSMMDSRKMNLLYNVMNQQNLFKGDIRLKTLLWEIASVDSKTKSHVYTSLSYKQSDRFLCIVKEFLEQDVLFLLSPVSFEKNVELFLKEKNVLNSSILYLDIFKKILKCMEQNTAKIRGEHDG